MWPIAGQPAGPNGLKLFVDTQGLKKLEFFYIFFQHFFQHFFSKNFLRATQGSSASKLKKKPLIKPFQSFTLNLKPS